MRQTLARQGLPTIRFAAPTGDDLVNTARFRCNACGEPLVRPVLSCPYCGAFRSAVPLDSADQLEDERDTYVDEPAHDPAAEEVVEYGAEDGVEPDDEHAAGADDEPTDIVYVEDQDTTEERDRDVPLAVPVDDPAATPSPASSGDLSGVRGRRVDAPLEAAPRPARAERSGPEPAGRRIEPTIGGPAPEPAARRVGAPEVRLSGGSRGEADAVDPLSPESRTGEEAPAAPSPEADGETRRGRRRRRRASAQRRVAPNPPAPGPTPGHRPAVEPPHDDEAYEDEADDEPASTHSSIDAFLLETEDRPRERRRRGWGGLIALLVILLLLVGGGGAAYY